ncbi:MAG: ADOP family duplicated permease [Longimicrobiales bacterium]
MANQGRRDRGGGPAALWTALLRWSVPAAHRDAVLGDAEEEYARRVQRDGAPAARSWFRRQALRSLGYGLRHRVERWTDAWTHPTRGDGTMMQWWTEMRLAARTLGRRPLFAATVVLTLGLGVGATTALFGVFRAIFLEPLPVPEPDRVVLIMEEGAFGCCGPASGPDYQDWRDRQRVFDGIMAMSPRAFTLTGQGEAERVQGTWVTASGFEMVGTPPLLGRWLAEEDELTDEPQVAVVSHGFWTRVLGADRDAVGRAVELDGSSVTVVGVMPPGYDIPSPWGGGRTPHDLFVPFPRTRLDQNRGSHGYPVLARLAEGSTLDAAQADMDRILAEIVVEHPDSHADRSARVFSLHEWIYGDVGGQLMLILGAAGVVLLIACGNVAGLQLARAAARESELAVRSALGASRGRLVRLLFSESLLLAGAGGIVGVGVSFLAVDAFKMLLPPTMPRVDAVGIDGAALLFAFGTTGLTVALFGVLPALLAARTDLASAVKEGGYATMAPVKERLRDAFIVAQIALGLVLVNGAAILVQSYTTLRGQDAGFTAEGVLTFSVDPRGPRYASMAERVAYFEEVMARVEALPRVQESGIITRLPLSGGTNGTVWVEGTPPPVSGEGVLVEVTSVAGDYFGVLGIPLLRGRLPLPEDSVSAAPGVVVNQAFVDQAWPDEDPLGKRFSFDTEEPTWLTVVGVVGDVRQWGLEQPALAHMYSPYPVGWSGSGYVTVRVAGDPAEITPEVRRAVLAVDGTQPPTGFRTMTDRVDSRLAQRRFYTTLIGLFAGVALLLAAAGIYGTISYFVARRTRELGIRMALGSGGRGVVRLVLRRGVRLAIWGVALGLVGVWASTRVLESLVYGMGPVDALTLVAGCLILGGTAVAASGVPALRAVRISPVSALRTE